MNKTLHHNQLLPHSNWLMKHSTIVPLYSRHSNTGHPGQTSQWHHTGGAWSSTLQTHPAPLATERCQTVPQHKRPAGKSPLYQWLASETVRAHRENEWLCVSNHLIQIPVKQLTTIYLKPYWVNKRIHFRCLAATQFPCITFDLKAHQLFSAFRAHNAHTHARAPCPSLKGTPSSGGGPRL